MRIREYLVKYVVMQYAVIETGGKQYKVSPGTILEVERLNDQKDSNVMFDKVLLYVDGENVQVGMPYLSGVNIKATIIEDMRGEKIRVSKFKAKSHFKKTIGHRQSLTQIKIDDIAVKKATSKE